MRPDDSDTRTEPHSITPSVVSKEAIALGGATSAFLTRAQLIARV